VAHIECDARRRRQNLEIPTDLKDWWIYLFPGDLLLVEILFMYAAATRIMPAYFGPKFEITDIWNYSQAQIALFLLLIVSVGLVIGSLLEGLSYGFFEKSQKKSSIILSAFHEVKRSRKDLMKQLLSDPELFPAKLWKGSFDAMEKNIEDVGEFTEAQLLHEAKEDESESLDGTAVAITFTQSFFLSFLFFPSIICWLIVREFVGIAILFGLFYGIYLLYLWKDQRNLTKTYWRKTFSIYVSHLWKKKSETPVSSKTTRKRTRKKSSALPKP